MRILIAPDKFKGTLSAKDAAAAIARGVRRAAEERGIEIEIEECPVADGGEGFLDCARDAIGGQEESVSVARPLFGSVGRISARVLIQRAEGAAYIEAADAVGIRHLLPSERNPEQTTSWGLGTQIDFAAQRSCSGIFIGLGGSATVDGGMGVAASLGTRFRIAGNPIANGCGIELAAIRSIDPMPAESGLWHTEIFALCDVSNPLLGPNGAARVYGPQKGATPEQVERLEAGLENLVKVCRECGISCDPDQPGAGAAGGLGFGLATFLGARLVPGAPFILDLLKFDDRAARADLVITGEGRLDSQTACGKAAAEVARRSAKAGKPCIAIVGDTEGNGADMRSLLAGARIHFESITSAAETAGNADAAMAEPRKWLEEAAYRGARAWLGAI